jgi:deoxyribose-phosphate aldolase
MYQFENYSYSEEGNKSRLKDMFSATEELQGIPVFKFMLGCIDLTSLEGSDTNEKIVSICRKAKIFSKIQPGIPDVAAVCFYPTFIKAARSELEGTGIRTASVAGAFPSGQMPLPLKIDEVKYALDQGAEEIDMVISRGRFLEGEHQMVFDEIAAIRQTCGSAHLKVILETGELQSIPNIRKASEIAINAGADFIKTSTGKVSPAATTEAFLVMADTVKEYYQNTGKRIGLKPAGGISTTEDALKYYLIVLRAAGNEWLNKEYCRIGASRLTDHLLNKILDPK